MTRRPADPSEVAAVVAEIEKPGAGTRVFQTASEFASTAPTKKYKRRDFSSIADKFLKEVERMIEVLQIEKTMPEIVWGGAKPEHLVALYSLMHREVYDGVLPGELAGDWNAAVSAVKKMLRDEFENEPIRCVEYLRWTFQQEKKKRARNRESTWRVSWRWAFMKRDLLTTFRTSHSRSR